MNFKRPKCVLIIAYDPEADIVFILDGREGEEIILMCGYVLRSVGSLLAELRITVSNVYTFVDVANKVFVVIN